MEIIGTIPLPSESEFLTKSFEIARRVDTLMDTKIFSKVLQSINSAAVIYLWRPGNREVTDCTMTVVT